MSAVYKSSSPYAITNTVNKYVTYLDVWQPPALTYSSQDKIIYLPEKYKNRPDLLSYDYYNTVGLWWVFAVYNSNVIKDPIYDMIPGIQILIPSKDNLVGLV